MSIKTLTVIGVGLLCITTPAQAEERKLGATANVTYMSRLMDKGGEYYGKQGALLEGVCLDLYGTGAALTVEHRAATSSGYETKDRTSYKLAYGKRLFADQAYETQGGVGWVYHHHSKAGPPTNDFYEWEMSLAWPKLIPGGWVPAYKVALEHGLGTSVSSARSWHLFSLCHDVSVEPLPSPLRLYSDVAYRDGLGGIREWTNATVGVSTEVACSKNLFIVPAVFHQISLSDALTPDDVTYAVVSAQYRH